MVQGELIAGVAWLPTWPGRCNGAGVQCWPKDVMLAQGNLMAQGSACWPHSVPVWRSHKVLPKRTSMVVWSSSSQSIVPAMPRSAYAQMGQKASAMTCIEAVLGEWLWHVGYAPCTGQVQQAVSSPSQVQGNQ